VRALRAMCECFLTRLLLHRGHGDRFVPSEPGCRSCSKKTRPRLRLVLRPALRRQPLLMLLRQSPALKPGARKSSSSANTPRAVRRRGGATTATPEAHGVDPRNSESETAARCNAISVNSALHCPKTGSTLFFHRSNEHTCMHVRRKGAHKNL
jgi:hypothetical protein